MKGNFYLDINNSGWRVYEEGKEFFRNGEISSNQFFHTYKINLIHKIFDDYSLFHLRLNDKDYIITKNGFYYVNYKEDYFLEFLNFDEYRLPIKIADGEYKEKIFGFFKTSAYFGFKYNLNYQQIRDIILYFEKFTFKPIEKKYFDFVAFKGNEILYIEKNSFSIFFEKNKIDNLWEISVTDKERAQIYFEYKKLEEIRFDKVNEKELFEKYFEQIDKTEKELILNS
jgi:hypothetical protein